MSSEALIAKLRDLTLEQPGAGYRALHAKLKDDPQFLEVSLKKVQHALQHIRGEALSSGTPSESTQTVGGRPDTSLVSTRGNEEAHAETSSVCDQPQLPNGLIASEVQQRLSRGIYSEIFHERIRLADVPLKGKGFLAAKQIMKGDTLLFDVAFCSSSRGPSEHMNMVRQCLDQTQSGFFKNDVMSLTTGCRAGLLGIVENNAWVCSRDSEHIALFVVVARFNHSCCPNAFVDATRSQAVVRALQDIAEGEEVCVSYVSPFEDLAVRREKLLVRGFECKCERCRQEDLFDPLSSVPCHCGSSHFIITDEALPHQICSTCGFSFDCGLCLLNLQKLEQANKFSRIAAAKQGDPEQLLKKLGPFIELVAPCMDNKQTSSYCLPTARVEVLEFFNQLTNSYYSLAQHGNPTALLESFNWQERYMSASTAIVARWTNQRDRSWFQSMQCLLTREFPSKEKALLWEQTLVDCSMLHFGQNDVPAGY